MKKLLTFVLATAFLASCQQEENEISPSVDRITISPIITRATEVNFEDGDQIGLTITKEDGSVYTSNELLMFGNGVFSGNLNWYSEGTEKSALVAYYPYNEIGAPTSFSVQSNQTDGYGKSDLMAASKSEVVPSANSISMIFKHVFTKMVINVENETGLDISSVVLKGSIPTANINLAELSVAVDENAAAADITAQQVTANTTYRAIVVPQTVSFTLAVTTSNNKTLTQKLASTTLVQSGQYSVNVRVLPDDIIVTLSGEIENWTDEGEIKADDNEEVSFEEHDGYFVYDGITYHTVTLANGTTWMADPLRYIPSGYTPSSDSKANSHIWYPYALNMEEGNTSVNLSEDKVIPLTDEASIAKLGYLYDIQAAFGTEITENNFNTFEGKQGICPPGWHIPTRAEYFNLVGNSTKDDSGTESGTQTNPDALFYNAGYQAAKIQSLIDAGFNYQFSGSRMSTGYTSTPKYQSTVICATNTTQTEWYGKQAMSYYMTSTAYKANYSSSTSQLTNIQFFGLMSTFTKANYPEGRLTLGYVSALSGQTIRCIKDQN